MKTILKELQLQYEGFLKTPFLWNEKEVFNLAQFDINSTKTTVFSTQIKKKLPLGKLVERFVSFEFEQNSVIKIIAENIQIQKEKITLGELDCLLLKENKPIHLEIIYKFYLYDSTVGKTELEHWIGPNKRDSLVQKLIKLKKKQLPLLYSKECVKYLKTLDLNVKNIEQQVYFKAQLFVPLKKYTREFSIINNDCIIGFYVNTSELEHFKDCKFYIPNKHNWLIKAQIATNWLSFDNFRVNIEQFLNEKKSPLCWLKKTNGELIKIFVIWW